MVLELGPAGGAQGMLSLQALSLAADQGLTPFVCSGQGGRQPLSPLLLPLAQALQDLPDVVRLLR